MAKVVLRGFLSRRLRAVLTGIAIALGVALMAGTYILTDTINRSFASIFSTAARGRDVVIVPRTALGTTAAAQTAPIAAGVISRVRGVPGVAVAAGEVFANATLFDARGGRLNTRAPSFVASTLPTRFENFSAVAGSLPMSSHDVAIDQSTAQRDGLAVGQPLRITGAGAALTQRISGIVKFAGSTSFGGAGVALLTPAQAQRVAGERGAYDTIVVAAAPSVAAAALRARIRAVLPRTLDVLTGTQEAAQQTTDLERRLGFLRTFLLIFAYVSLFVGAFIIFNTFSITVAQRTREFGLLRTLGATRGQVVRSVIAEGALLGLGGSLVGFAAGFALAPGLDELFKAFGADLPDSGTVVELRTVWVSLVAGTAVTIAAGLLPAMRAARVTPIAALREGVSLREGAVRRPRRRRRMAAVIAAAVVVALALAASPAAAIAAVAVVAAIVAAVRAAPARRRVGGALRAFVIGLARLLAGLFAWRGIVGRLARDNTIRQPGRTAVTAAALMIGVGLVSFVSILAAGTKASIDQAIDSSFAGNLIVQSSATAGNAGIPAEIPAALRTIPGVREVSAVAFTVGRADGLHGTQAITAVDRSFARMYRIRWDVGSNATLAALGTTGTVLNKNFADAHHYRVGQQLSVLAQSGRRVTLVVRGIVTDDAGLLADMTITLALARSAFAQRTDAVDFVGYAPGAADGRVQPAVNRLLAARFPQAESQTAAQFKASLAGMINSLLTFIYVLLALSVIVSLFGIVNTLVLSIFERTRELGMLRAIGTTRRQLREMVRYESIITALIGGVLGIALGIVLALILDATALSGTGFVLVVPPLTMLVLFILAGAAGLGAAVWPARRAARVDILAAIATQ